LNFHNFDIFCQNYNFQKLVINIIHTYYDQRILIWKLWVFFFHCCNTKLIDVYTWNMHQMFILSFSILDTVFYTFLTVYEHFQFLIFVVFFFINANKILGIRSVKKSYNWMRGSSHIVIEYQFKNIKNT